jgi:hypothetical protein
MCTAHPHYDGTLKPDGGCAQCLARWVACPSERYARAEFAIVDAALAAKKPPVNSSPATSPRS